MLYACEWQRMAANAIEWLLMAIEWLLMAVNGRSHGRMAEMPSYFSVQGIAPNRVFAHAVDVIAVEQHS